MSVAKLSLPACLFGTKLQSRPPTTRTSHNREQCLTSELLTKNQSPLLNRLAWIQNLKTDHDRDFIIDGITHGFQIISSDSVLEPAEITNYKSATAGDIHDKVEKQIRDEIRNGNYVITQFRFRLAKVVCGLGISWIPRLTKSGINKAFSGINKAFSGINKAFWYYEFHY